MRRDTSHGSLSSLWKSHPDVYARFRPQYSKDLLDSICHAANLQRKHLALDVGCGNGQVSFDLAQRFDHVIAVDASAEQLRHARPARNITYLQRPAEQTGLKDHSVDLITAATCLHWFDVSAFYREALRVLHPQGALAMWGYFPSSLRFHDCQRADEALQDICKEMWGYFHPVLHKCMEAGYAGLEPPPGAFHEVHLFDTTMQLKLGVEEVVGYVRSWSCHGPYVEQHGQHAFEERLTVLSGCLREVLNGEGSVAGTLQLANILARVPNMGFSTAGD